MWPDSGFEELARNLAAHHPTQEERFFGVSVPLRACPLGAHVDHQGGEVTGVTLDRRLAMVAVATDEARLRIESVGFPGLVEVPLDPPPAAPQRDWGDYARAAVAALSEGRRLRRGFRAVMHGDLPGMGLSSSAAVLLAYLLALAEVNEVRLDRRTLARLVQRAENSFIGLASGLLDQTIMLFGEKGRLTHLRCSDFEVRQVTQPEPPRDYRVLVAFSGAPRSLVDTGYNERVSECREAARLLLEAAGRQPGDAPLLGDVEADWFEEKGHILPPTLRRRATHYFSEVARVREGVAAWERADLESFGSLMTASGESSIVNFECGTEPLITLYESLRDTSGVFGARFSGAGFGGSCLAFVAPEAAAEAAAEVSRCYTARHPDLAPEARFEICRPAGPARLLWREV